MWIACRKSPRDAERPAYVGNNPLAATDPSGPMMYNGPWDDVVSATTLATYGTIAANRQGHLRGILE